MSHRREVVVAFNSDGALASASDTLRRVDAQVLIGDRIYPLRTRPEGWGDNLQDGVVVLPTSAFWHEPAVQVGDTVVKRQLIFQANVWIFTALVFTVGVLMGFGKAAVYRHIPDYFPRDIGVVGGIVGVIGGLGGFFFPLLFGYLLQATGVWTTSWVVLAVFSAACLAWMHVVVQRMQREQQPELMRQMEHGRTPAALEVGG